MGLNIFCTEFSYLDNDLFLRMDVDYIDISKELFNTNNYKFLNEFIIGNIETGKSIKRKDYNNKPSKYAHLVVRNIKDGKINCNNLIYLNEEKGEKLRPYEIKKGDIIIAISSNVGASFYFINEIEGIQLTLSHYLTKLRVDERKLNPKLLVFYLNSRLMKKYFRSVETGKTVKNLAKNYISNLPILLPESLDEQKKILELIEIIDTEITTLKSQIKDPIEIINNIFSEEFNFDITKFENLKNESSYCLSLSNFSRNIDLRFSFKFHRNAGKFVQNSLNEITSKKIKDFLEEPIKLGKGISPKDYDKMGDNFYISMADIKKWRFEPNDAKKVSQGFFLKNTNKEIKKNDIILARSGEGTIGKVAIIDKEYKGIYSDFTMRIRLKDYNHWFAYYYFRSQFFQYLVFIYKKGLGNNTNIFPSQISEFPLIDIPIPEQDRIVKKINLEINKQNKILDDINNKNEKISEILETMIFKSHRIKF
jgi:restriction endonuclease S subunit